MNSVGSPAPVKFNYFTVRCLYWFHILVSLETWILVNKILSMAAPLWPLRSHWGRNCRSLSLLHTNTHRRELVCCVLTDTHFAYTCQHCGCSLFRLQQTILPGFFFFFGQHYIITDSLTFTLLLSLSLTSGLDFLYAHVDHHRSLGVVGFDQCGQVTAVHLLYVPQVRLAVVRHHLWALLVDV